MYHSDVFRVPNTLVQIRIRLNNSDPTLKILNYQTFYKRFELINSVQNYSCVWYRYVLVPNKNARFSSQIIVDIVTVGNGLDPDPNWGSFQNPD